ncbi:hypothetical protein [Sphingobacterium thalpophilum]|uniref:hypothetical protein n=1 Tax=Sphingobacterium thalpophilum TaxID=259 RepID=UPI0024A61C84|nr:hypothetical protein [Sphingobacterium thalpophilum]
MDYKALQKKMDLFFESVNPDDLLEDVLNLGYEVEEVGETSDMEISFDIKQVKIEFKNNERKLDHLNKVSSKGNQSFWAKDETQSYALAS